VTHFQYQQRAEPLEPSLIHLPNLSEWFQPASEPVRPPVPRMAGLWAGVTEPTLFVVPGFDTWYRPASEPVRLPLPSPTGGASFVPNPDWAAETITLDKWHRPASEPVRPPPPRPAGGSTYQGNPPSWPGEDLTLDKWHRQASEPVWTVPPRLPGEFAGITQPTLFQIPTMDMWWPGIARLPLQPPRLHQGSFAADPSVFRGRFYHDARGKYRVFNTAEYRFYRSTDTPPAESDAAFATNASLPHTPADTYADGDWYLSASYFNGVIDSGFLPLGPQGETYLRLGISGATETLEPPAAPVDWRLEQQPSGVVRIVGFLLLTDTAKTYQWAIAYSTDGTNFPADAPTLTPSIAAGGLAVLSYDLPSQAHDTTVKVRLQVRRNDGTEGSPTWCYSEGSVILTATADATGPTAPTSGRRWPGQLSEVS